MGREESERCGDLLVPWELRELLEEMEAKELRGDDLGDARIKPPLELEPPLDPFPPLPEDSGERRLGEPVLLSHDPKRLHLFSKGGPPARVIELEPCEKSLWTGPRSQASPSRRFAAFAEREEALEPVDEKELSVFFDHDKRHVGVDVRQALDLWAELEGDLMEGDLAQPHRFPLASGSERTWKVG